MHTTVIRKFTARFILLAIVFVQLLTTGAFAATPGVIIYVEPPVGPLKLAQAISYLSYEKTSIEYGNLTLVNGKTVEIHNEGIIGVFPPPPASGEGISDADIEAFKKKAEEMIRLHPTVRGPVKEVLNRWSVAWREGAKRALQAKQETPQRRDLLVNGVTYPQANLEAVEGGSVKITHSDGVASIPIGALSGAQIAYLNSTSSRGQIDPNWKEKQKAAEQALAAAAAEKTKLRNASRTTPSPQAPGTAPAPSSNPATLEEALLAYHWKWGDHHRPIEFHKDGQMTGLTNSTAWVITGPRTVRLTRVGESFEITFDEGFTAFESAEHLGGGRRGAPLDADRSTATDELRDGLSPAAPAESKTTQPDASESEIDWLMLSAALSNNYYLGASPSNRLLFNARGYLPEIRDWGGNKQRAIAKSAIGAFGAEGAAALERERSGHNAMGTSMRFLGMLASGLGTQEHEVHWSNGAVTTQSELTLDPSAVMEFGRSQLASLEADMNAAEKMARQRDKLNVLWADAVRPAMLQRVASSAEARLIGISAERMQNHVWLAFSNIRAQPLHNVCIRVVNNLSAQATFQPFYFIPVFSPGQTMFTEQSVAMEIGRPASGPGTKPPDRRLEIEYLCDEGRMSLSRIPTPQGLNIRYAFVNGVVRGRATFVTADGDHFFFNAVTGSRGAMSVNATWASKGNSSFPVSLSGDWKEDFSKPGQIPYRVLIDLVGPEPPGKKNPLFGSAAPKYRFNWYDGKFSLSMPPMGFETPIYQLQKGVSQLTPMEEALLNSKRKVVASYPDVAKAGSKFNLEFIAIVKKWQQERPESFRDPAWPLNAAKEVDESLKAK